MVKAERVAGGIAKPCFAPEPCLHLGLALEGDALRDQARKLGFDIVALEIDLRRALARDLAFGQVQRKRGAAVCKLEPRIMGAFDDQFEAELAIEGDRGVEVGRRNGHLIEAHFAYLAARPISASVFAAIAALSRAKELIHELSRYRP